MRKAKAKTRARRYRTMLLQHITKFYHRACLDQKEFIATQDELVKERYSHVRGNALTGSPRTTSIIIRRSKHASLIAVANVMSHANVRRKPHCHGYGSLCYDPRFVGGDGVMFYFHGAKGGNFAIVSDDNLQINAHFIGTRPEGRTRDYTWVQALAVMFDTHTLVLATKRVSKWDDSFDALTVRWDGEAVNIPTEGDAEWRTNSEEREVIVERTDETNGVKVTVAGLVELNIKVRAIGEHENKVHNYQLPADDAFAHLETQFKFIQASPLVEGVLGKSYRPDYVSPVKLGVPMPMMGGEDKYVTPSLYSPLCNACRFKGQTGSASI
ncbi:hypothetical protein V6N12_051654 [Hibiscus sabdariffa]|uniref:Uncharacterized protein n=1 Tax=Hibiscus sabdariffa TaxID=183260 RepID=A0ABR2GGL3_9ROSI